MPDLTVIVCLAFDHRASTDGLKKFKECIFQCSFVETAMEVTGTYDLIVNARLSSLAEYTEQMDRIADSLAKFVTRIEANFVGKKVDRRRSTGGAMWLPCGDGKRRVSTNLIDKVVANGDYMEVHVGEWTCLVHDTIRHMCEQLDHEQFIQLHRSVVARIDFIERLVHQNRRWIAKLRDGSLQRVAKSHVPDIIRLMEHDSAGDGVSLAKLSASNEIPERVIEMPMRIVS